MKKIYEVSQECAINGILNRKIAIDFTCGNGGDSEFLSKHFNYVYAYDIQKEAIDICENKHLNNVKFIHKSHEFFDEDIKQFDVGMFNLGYLPGGDQTVFTDQNIVIKTLDKALGYLNSKGRIVVTCYPGFEHGEKEAKAVEKFCAQLASKQFDISKIQLINRNKAPYIILIDKH